MATSMIKKENEWVKKSGDTMTGTLVLADKYLNIKHSSSDITNSNNNVSSNTWSSGYQFQDSLAHRTGTVRSIFYTNGDVGLQFTTFNRDTEGNEVSNSILIRTQKNGNATYSIDKANAFRNALGLGNTTGALPVANGGTDATNQSDASKNINGFRTYYTNSSTSFKMQSDSGWGCIFVLSSVGEMFHVKFNGPNTAPTNNVLIGSSSTDNFTLNTQAYSGNTVTATFNTKSYIGYFIFAEPNISKV